MLNNKNEKKGFTIVELIVVMAIIGILVLLAMPKFMGYTEKARLTSIKNNIKQLENASERYYIKEQDWPRLTDIPYTAEQLESFAEEIKNRTGAVVTIDKDGKYYPLDYDLLQKYVQKPKDGVQYILQNPVGEVFYLDNLTELGKATVSEFENKKPENEEPSKPPIKNEIIIEDDGTSLDFSENSDTYVVFGDIGVAAKTVNIRFYIDYDATGLTKQNQLLQYGKDYSQEVLSFGDVSSYIENESFSILSGVSNSGSNYYRTAITLTIPKGWNTFSLIWNESTNRYDIFLNGIKQNVITATFGDAEMMYFDQFVISKGYYSNFDGRIDKIAIWSTSNYDFDFGDTITTDAEGLEGFWVFNSTQGNIIKDLSGHGRDGVVYNANYKQN